jgi:UDP-N-acetylmuramate dehydrogenase
LGLGGAAAYFAEPTTRDELVTIVERARDADLPVRLIGSGSNILVSDEGFSGLVIRMLAPTFGQITVDADVLTAGGGAQLSHVIISAAREGLAGLEALVGIPGTVGGALHGNAGDRTSHAGNCLEEATVLTRTGEFITRQRDQMHFSYRESSLDELAILEAKFRLEAEDRDELVRRVQKMWIVARASQPSRERRTACLFKDPMGATANELIDQVGMRGYSQNGVSLYERDANFVIASADASSSEVVKLIDKVRQRVSDQLAVDLAIAIQVW